MYVSVDGLAQWQGITPEEVTAQNPAAERELEGVEARLLAYILPNSPCRDCEQEAFAKAVYYQYDHEQSDMAKKLLSASGALSSFQIGNWQGAFREQSGSESQLFPAGLSPTTNGILLRAGLLYKGGVRLC